MYGTMYMFSISQGGLDVNSQDDMGHTALHFAIQNGNTSVIEQLVKHGADVNARDADDVTPLYMIIMYRDILDIPSSACPEIKKVLVKSTIL